MKPVIRRETLDDEPTKTPFKNGCNGRLAGRLASGRFGAGNRAAVGRTQASTEWRTAAREAIGIEGLKTIFRAASAKARSGDIPAARFCVEYCVGKPRERIDLTVMDDAARWASADVSDEAFE